MGANFSRLKIWTDNETLTNEDLNAEFDNILANFVPLGMDDYSASVGQMQIQVDPGEVGSENLATSLAGELARIRFILSEITGNTYWYESPARSLASGNLSPAFVLPFDGVSASSIMGDLFARGVYGGQNGSVSISPANIDTTEKNFGGGSVDIADGLPLVYPGRYFNPLRGTIGVWFKGVATNQCLAFNAKAGVELWVNSGGVLEARFREQTPSGETAKEVTLVTGVTTVVGGVDWKLAILSWTVGGFSTPGNNSVRIFLNEDLEVENTALTIDIQETKDGGYWIYGAERNDPAWEKYSSFLVAPATEAVDPWTVSTGGSGVATVSGGILTLGGAGFANISRAAYGGWGSGRATEFKLKLNSYSFSPSSASTEMGFKFFTRDDVNNLGFSLNITPSTVSICDSGGFCYYTFSNNSMDWNVYRVMYLFSGGNLTISVYVNGVSRATITTAAAVFADATVGDLFRFGSTDALGIMSSEMEYIGTYGANIPVISTLSYTGYCTEMFALKTAVSTASFAESVFNNGSIEATGFDAFNQMSTPHELQITTELTATGVAGKYIAPILNSSYPLDLNGYIFWSDGKSELDLSIALSMSTSSATGAAFAGLFIRNLSESSYTSGGPYITVATLDNEEPVASARASGVNTLQSVFMSKRVTLAAGVYRMDLLLANSNAAETTTAQHVTYSVSRG